MRMEHTVEVAAPASRVWEVLVDLESWPELTASVTSVERLDPAPLRVGSRVRLRQPRLPESDWTVTEVVDGQRFVWEMRSPGVRVVASHAVVDRGDSTLLRLEVEQRGLLASTIGLLTRPITRRYVRWEADGIKNRAESR